jgi:hypothetical protein
MWCFLASTWLIKRSNVETPSHVEWGTIKTSHNVERSNKKNNLNALDVMFPIVNMTNIKL